MARVIDVDAYRRARQLYIELKNMNLVSDKLRQEGYATYGRSTLFRWKAEALEEGDDWEAAAEKFDKEYVKAKAQLRGFNEQWALRLVEAAEKFIEKIGVEPKHVDANALTKLLNQAERLRQAQNKSKYGESEVVRELFDLLTAHPKIGPLVRQEWKTLLDRLDKRMKDKERE